MKELVEFFHRFQQLFENDGRHHIWIGNSSNDGLIIYDKHNVLYGYGPLKEYRSILEAKEFQERAFKFPYPHGHSYNSANDAEVCSLLAYWDWQVFPLIANEDEEFVDENS